MFTRRILLPLLAVAVLALASAGAKAQINIFPNPYAGPYGAFGYPVFSGNPVILGYGAPPFAVGPGGLSPYGPGFQPGSMAGATNYPYGYGPYPEEGNFNPANVNPNAAGVYPGYAYYNPGTYTAGTNYVPQTSNSIQARLESNNIIHITWQGDTSTVSQISFALLDRNGRVLAQRTITGPPTDIRFRRTSRAAFYRVIVRYANGTTSTVISPV
ncbi:MAG TPA: hypothetical protein VFB38_25045 [Chthonomonadaceae bacterium]|nr:hypothetical protein [Chthonomonadaceae bacterium]